MMTPTPRIGLGYDIHRLEAGRPLILGGLAIPFDKGLFGHSDADVVLHALADACLGAAGLPDIGELFPDTDPAWKGADSRGLLAEVWRRVAERGLTLGNADLVIHAEVPKLSPYKVKMAAAIAAWLKADVAQINVKAKTNEKMGAIGRGEAIACTAVVLLVPSSEA